MNEQNVAVSTRHGTMPAFVACPDGEGPWPPVILYMDARGVREELRNMGRRIARNGYVCILPDLYYRLGDLRFDLAKRDEAMILMIRAARNSITRRLVLDDTAAVVAWLDGSDRVKEGPIGVVGYCMGGPFVTWAAAEFPSRIAAAASLFGVEMVVDGEDSPHRFLPRIRAGLYFGFAEKDRFSPPELIRDFKAALDAAGNDYDLETIAGADHGYCFPERPVYVPEAAEAHWQKLFSLWARHLGERKPAP